MKNFKARVEELVKENEDLHEQLNNFITPKEWQVILLEINLEVKNYFGYFLQTIKITDLEENFFCPLTLFFWRINGVVIVMLEQCWCAVPGK